MAEATQPTYTIKVNADPDKGEYFPNIPAEIGSLDELYNVRANATYFQPHMITVTVEEEVEVKKEVDGVEQAEKIMQARDLLHDEVNSVLDAYAKAKAEEFAQAAASAPQEIVSEPVDGTEPKRNGRRQAPQGK